MQTVTHIPNSLKTTPIAQLEEEGAYELVSLSKLELLNQQAKYIQIRESIFSTINLTGSHFEESRIRHARFTNCNLTGAQFGRTKLKKTDFRSSIIHGIKIDADAIKGAIISIEQVYDIIGVLGVEIK